MILSLILSLIIVALSIILGFLFGVDPDCPLVAKVFDKAYKHNLRCDEYVIKHLSYDTQTILKNYMHPINYRGKHMYIVDNIERFDTDLRQHPFYDLGYNCGDRRPYCFDKYIKKHLEEGDAFAVVINGKKYVAVMPMFNIDSDSLIDSPAHSGLDATVQKV